MLMLMSCVPYISDKTCVYISNEKCLHVRSYIALVLRVGTLTLILGKGQGFLSKAVTENHIFCKSEV